MTLLHNKLKLARKEAKKTRPDVKEATGIGIQTLYRYETGITKPSLEKLQKLAKFYKKPIESFLLKK